MLVVCQWVYKTTWDPHSIQVSLQWALQDCCIASPGTVCWAAEDPTGVFSLAQGRSSRGESWIRSAVKGPELRYSGSSSTGGYVCGKAWTEALEGGLFKSLVDYFLFPLKQVLFSSPSWPLCNWAPELAHEEGLLALLAGVAGEPCPWTVRRTFSTTSSGSTVSPRTEASEASSSPAQPNQNLNLFLKLCYVRVCGVFK